MKRLTFAVLFVTVSAGSAFSQKAKLKEAKSLLNETPPKAVEACAAIDAAAQEETTKNLAETWFYRGQAYAALQGSPECGDCANIAYQSFQKAEELDLRNEYKLKIETQSLPLLKQTVFNNGVDAFQAERYTDALKAFELVIKMFPEETGAILNAAMSADNARQYEKAIQYYRDLIIRKAGDDKTYGSLSRALLNKGDTATALSTLKEGKNAYPDSIGLLLTEINVFLASGRGKEALSSLNQAIVKDPNNPSFYLAIGSVNEGLAHPTDAAGNTLPAPVNQQAYMSSAMEAYRKGLSIDSNHFELNYNMGAMLFNEGTELDNGANAQKSDALFKSMKEQAKEKYKSSAVYLEKALSIKPDDTGTMNSLKMLYYRTQETDKYNRMKAMLEKQ